MEGRWKEAKEKYQEAAGLAKKLGFTEGVTNAKAGMKRCKDAENKAA